MPAPDALDAALALFKDPVKARSLPGRPLPPDMAGLLAIAVGNEEALAAASRRSGFARQPLQDAAGFFIEQALFCRDADSYRVLGGGPHSTHEELRHNMALLMRWLHPDLQSLRKGPLDREVFASRVSRAWEDLKTPERREAYDLRRTPESSRPAAPRSATDAPPAAARATDGSRPAGGGSANGKTRSGKAGGASNGAGRPGVGKAGAARPMRNGKSPGAGGRGAGAGTPLPHRPRPLSVHKIEEASLWVRLWGLLWGRR
ncbi:J domain-containing protein [Ancylobacter sp. IITR112]|uniref:J domain-containing protein n=1 Tax=Ancylobacter sp. IITR112 TaxID=3138073 RepID=UPI00352BAD72